MFSLQPFITFFLLDSKCGAAVVVVVVVNFVVFFIFGIRYIETTLEPHTDDFASLITDQSFRLFPSIMWNALRFIYTSVLRLFSDILLSSFFSFPCGCEMYSKNATITDVTREKKKRERAAKTIWMKNKIWLYQVLYGCTAIQKLI